MKKLNKITKILILAFICIYIFSVCVIAADETQIVIFDYFCTFDIWQGEGDSSVIIDYTNDDKVIQALEYKNFKYILDADNNEIQTNFYTAADEYGFVKITFNFEYLKTFADGKYCFKAMYENIAVDLVLYVVTDKMIADDLIYYPSESWNGIEYAIFCIDNAPCSISASLFLSVKNNGEQLSSESFIVTQFGNTVTIALSPDYLRTLSAGEHCFDVEFLNISGIMLKIEISDFYCTGDANGDGQITAADARLTLRVSAKLETLSADAFLAADVNNDGNVTAADARKILRVTAKIEEF